MNALQLSGHLAHDPIYRELGNGTVTTELVITTKREFYRPSSALMRQEMCRVECVVWGKMATRAAKTLRKGDFLEALGRLENHTWNHKPSGEQRTRLRAHLFEIHFPEAATVPEPADVSAGGVQ